MSVDSKVIIFDNDFSERVDKFLSNVLKLSRSYVKYLIENDLIKVNEKRVKSSYILKKGDLISINLVSKNTSYFKDFKQLDSNETKYESRYETKNETKNEFMDYIIKNMRVLYEDSDVIVLDKLPIVVNKVKNGGFSVIDYLLLKGIDPFIVHRLDRQTTGCLIVAKNYNTALFLSNLFKNREVIKKYYAIVEGVFPYDSIKIEGDIYHTKNPLKKEIISYGKNAITIVNKIKVISSLVDLLKDFYIFESFKVKKEVDCFTFLEINIITGRTHQIRVHLSKIGYPIVGDFKYGSNYKVYLELNLASGIYKLETFFLHSYYLKLANYETKSEPLWKKLIF